METSNCVLRKLIVKTRSIYKKILLHFGCFLNLVGGEEASVLFSDL